MLYPIATWISVLVVLACLSGIGRLVGGRGAMPFSQVWVGWGVVTVVLTLVVGVEPPLPLTWLVLMMGAAGAVGLLANGPRRESLLAVGQLWLLTLPLLVVWSTNGVFMWDDFAHRLPSLAYLYDYDSLPRSGLPASVSDFPAYPYTLTFLGFAVCRLLGPYEPLAIAATNGALLVMLGGMVARLLRPRGAGWAGLAVGMLLVTALAPSFMPKLVASAYQDAALGWAVAVAWLLWRRMVLTGTFTWRAWLQVGLVLALVVGLKQVGIVLATLLVLAMAAVHAANLAPRRAAGLMAAMLLVAPMMLTWGGWRDYVAHHLAGGEFAMMPFANWNWPLIPTMGLRLLADMWEKPLVYAPLLVLSLLVLLPRTRRACATPPTLVALAVGWGYTGFLAVMYLGAFGDYEASVLASLSRYLQHINWLVWLALVVLAHEAGWLVRLRHPYVQRAMVVALLVLPLLLQRQLVGRPNAEALEMERVAARLRPLLDNRAQAVVQVDEPEGSGFRSKVLKYELRGMAHVRQGITRFGTPSYPAPAAIVVIFAEDGLAIQDCRTLPCVMIPADETTPAGEAP